MPSKHEKRPVTGVLLLDKPIGLTSNSALMRAKHLYNAEKAGHTGTLDPFASGLLPVCFGEATKFAGHMLSADKAYRATVRLGRTTTTSDPEGEVLSESPIAVAAADLSQTLDRFTGRISQRPPMHSAIKVQGRPLYELARQGIAIPRETREVTIYRLEVRDYRPPLLELDVACSKGTYIRVLAEDIGKSLGCGAMLQELRRVHSGDLDVADAVTLQELAEMSADERDSRLAAPDRLIAHLPQLRLDESTALDLAQGRVGPSPSGVPPGLHRAYGPADEFLGLVEHVDGILRARRMMTCVLRRDQ